ncbi:MAG: EsaB/YukD family protein [Eubacteriales bacterium]|nr:EsaB/YukD family protein [Eubacteriales bacterium]
MEDKVLVDIYVPASGKQYDVRIPLVSSISDVIKTVSKMITDMSDDSFTASEDTVLCIRDTGTILNINISVYAAGITNGTRLMLI